MCGPFPPTAVCVRAARGEVVCMERETFRGEEEEEEEECSRTGLDFDLSGV